MHLERVKTRADAGGAGRGRGQHAGLLAGRVRDRGGPNRRQPEFAVFKKRLINAPSATFSRRAYFSKPRRYGVTGGRGPVLKSGPRVER